MQCVKLCVESCGNTGGSVLLIERDTQNIILCAVGTKRVDTQNAIEIIGGGRELNISRKIYVPSTLCMWSNSLIKPLQFRVYFLHLADGGTEVPRG